MPKMASFRWSCRILALLLAMSSGSAFAAKGADGKNATKVAKCPEKSPPFCAAWSLCQKGALHACSDLGVRYERGISVQVSIPKAIAYYGKGCTKKVKAGCFPAARLLLDTKDKASAARAFQFLKLSCDPARPRACAMLSWMYLHGNGTAKDLAQAKKIADIACKKHIRRACYVVNNVDLLQAKTAAGKAQAVKKLDGQCVQGYGLACVALSIAYKSGLLATNPKKAQHYLLKGCEASDGQSCFQLAEVRKAQRASNEELFSLYERACASRYPLACSKAKKYKKALAPPKDLGPAMQPAVPPTSQPSAPPKRRPASSRPAPR